MFLLVKKIFYATFQIFFSPILLQINPCNYIPSFIKIGWGVAEKIVEESHTEMDKLLLLIGFDFFMGTSDQVSKWYTLIILLWLA